MAHHPLPPEIADAIARFDREAASWPEELVAEWKKIRGYCRAKHSESHRVLPAASLAVQEIAQVRQHAQNAMDAMSGVFGRKEDEPEPEAEPETAKHGKLRP